METLEAAVEYINNFYNQELNNFYDKTVNAEEIQECQNLIINEITTYMATQKNNIEKIPNDNSYIKDTVTKMFDYGKARLQGLINNDLTAFYIENLDEFEETDKKNSEKRQTIITKLELNETAHPFCDLDSRISEGILEKLDKLDQESSEKYKTNRNNIKIAITKIVKKNKQNMVNALSNKASNLDETIKSVVRDFYELKLVAFSDKTSSVEKIRITNAVPPQTTLYNHQQWPSEIEFSQPETTALPSNAIK